MNKTDGPFLFVEDQYGTFTRLRLVWCSIVFVWSHHTLQLIPGSYHFSFHRTLLFHSVKIEGPGFPMVCSAFVVWFYVAWLICGQHLKELSSQEVYSYTYFHSMELAQLRFRLLVWERQKERNCGCLRATSVIPLSKPLLLSFSFEVQPHIDNQAPS